MHVRMNIYIYNPLDMKHHQSVLAKWVTLNDMHAQHMFLVIKGPCIIIQVKEGRKEGSYPQGSGAEGRTES